MRPGDRYDQSTGKPIFDVGTLPRQFRVTCRGIVPYYTLPFPEAAVTEIRSGPKNYARTNRESLESFLGLSRLIPLAQSRLPKRKRRMTDGMTGIRVQVPGCSTTENRYRIMLAGADHVRKIRVYVDMSVFGGALDEEFPVEPSRRFFHRVEKGEFVVVLSTHTLDELCASAIQVLEVLRHLPEQCVETISASDEAELSANAYIQAGAFGKASRMDSCFTSRPRPLPHGSDSELEFQAYRLLRSNPVVQRREYSSRIPSRSTFAARWRCVMTTKAKTFDCVEAKATIAGGFRKGV